MIINNLSESLLSIFSKVSLIDKYDVYQKLMEYWEETMQDDVYAVCLEGYSVGRKIIYEYFTKKKKVNGTIVEEKTDRVKSYDGEIIPKSLLIEHFFSDKLKAMKRQQGKLDVLIEKLDELVEENNGEDGYFFYLEDIKDAAVRARINKINNVPDNSEELSVLQEYLQQSDKISAMKKILKQLDVVLDMAAREKYEQLSEEEIKLLLVEDKWLSTIYNGINMIHADVSHHLSSRITELVERYEFTLPECENKVTDIEKKVKSHLEKMGFAC
jgi:type I restriction enzyme M protein